MRLSRAWTELRTLVGSLFQIVRHIRCLPRPTDKKQLRIDSSLLSDLRFQTRVTELSDCAASPFHFRVTDPHRDLINPAVNGTLNLLKSALLEPKIQRVVITSSFAALVNPHPPVYTFTEKDWNEFSLKEVETKGLDVDAFRELVSCGREGKIGS
jgi:nucleoside-diphosphate-sugar epimerase